MENVTPDLLKIVHLLQKANDKITRRYNYPCGLEPDDKGKTLRDDRATFFFSSPDGQNGELYYELTKLGFRHSKYHAEYYWKVRKDGFAIDYTEGDVYVYKMPKVCVVCQQDNGPRNKAGYCIDCAEL